MEDIKLSMQLYSGYRFNISAFMYLPQVVSGYGGVYGINSNPIVTLKYTPPKGSDIDTKKATYKVTPKNLYKTIKFFNKVVKIFYDKDLQDLFLRGDNNELIFNSDYNKLKVITDYDPKLQCALKAIPSVIQYDDGKEYEGILLYINTHDYVVPMPLAEVEAVLGLFTNLSFSTLSAEMMLSYLNAKMLNRITEQSQFPSQYSNHNQW